MVDEYKNTCHSTINMKLADVKSSTCTDCAVENIDKDPNFEVGDHVRISQYKNIFAKVYTTNWSEKMFAIKKV